MNIRTGKLSKLFSALGDPTRYKMVKLIASRPDICVSELATEVGISPAGASQHLSVLEKAGFLRPYRAGKKMCYEIENTPENVELIKLIERDSK